MKSLLISSIMLIFVFSLSDKTTAQEWQWKWGENAGSGHGTPVTLFMNSCDFRNNYYGQMLYQEKIYFQDTTLIHGAGTSNYVFLKYDSTGKFFPPLDIWTEQTQLLNNPLIVPDKDLNLYIGGTYAVGFHVQDTFFQPGPGVSYLHPEIFLLKMRNDWDIVWGKIISGTWQDDLTGLIPAENGELILSTNHICSSEYPTTVNYLNQDTVFSARVPFSSILKVNQDGIIQWKKDIIGDIHQLQLTEGKNGLIYYTGYSGDNIVIGADTLQYPWGPDYMFANFILSFNQDGELMESKYLNPHLRFYYFQVDELGNKYISQSFQDTLVLGQDTILGPVNSSWTYVAKLNPSVDEAIWYHIIPKQTGQTNYSLQIMLHQNRVLFATTANKNLRIGNANLQLGNYTKGVFGEFQENGDVSNISLLSGVLSLSTFHSITDNCGNIIAGGDFQYEAIIANDTIFSYSIIKDAYIAKLQTAAPLFFNLGNDTTVCESYTLVGPTGYTTYIWNDSITAQNWWTVTETGGYVLQCANSEGCWAHDSIFVTVHNGIEVTMPGDTLVCIDDSLSFSVDGSYESYLWSTGDTTNAITFPATELGPGSHWISLEITDGPCYLIDSLLVTVHQAIEADLPSDTIVCSNELISLSVPAGYEHYLWSTGDTTSTIAFPAAELGPGSHWISLEISDGPCYLIDSLLVTVHQAIEADLPFDTLICSNELISLSVPAGYEHYLWSTGDTTSAIAFPATELGPGTHWISLEITDGPCYLIDSLLVMVHPAIEADIPFDTIVCSNEFLFLSVPAGYEHYLWTTGDTTNSISIVGGSLGTGQQQLEISIQDGPCWFADSMTVIIHPEIIAELPSDTTIKIHDSIVLSVPDTYEHYLWSTGDTTHTFIARGISLGIGSHQFSLEIWDGPCYFIDSLQLTVEDDSGINDQSGEDIVIIPNPCYDNLRISSPIQLHFIEIIDLEGNIVYSEELNSKAPTHYLFNLSVIRKGVYLIRMYSADSMITRKMIKF